MYISPFQIGLSCGFSCHFSCHFLGHENPTPVLLVRYDCNVKNWRVGASRRGRRGRRGLLILARYNCQIEVGHGVSAGAGDEAELTWLRRQVHRKRVGDSRRRESRLESTASAEMNENISLPPFFLFFSSSAGNHCLCRCKAFLWCTAFFISSVESKSRFHRHPTINLGYLG